jgi:acetyltransferase-like isoleucine patch superfamily enzyme
VRNTKRYPIKGKNSLWQLYKTVSFLKTFRNVIVIEIARYVPFFKLKNWMYRRLIGMKVGEYTSFAFKVTPDLMFPELITVGSNTIIGYNTTILAHEYLIDEHRLGEVIIGNNVLVGANTTILPGVTIGDGAKISAATLVHKDVPAGAFVGGNPMTIISMPNSNT